MAKPLAEVIPIGKVTKKPDERVERLAQLVTGLEESGKFAPDHDRAKTLVVEMLRILTGHELEGFTMSQARAFLLARRTVEIPRREVRFDEEGRPYTHITRRTVEETIPVTEHTKPEWQTPIKTTLTTPSGQREIDMGEYTDLISGHPYSQRLALLIGMVVEHDDMLFMNPDRMPTREEYLGRLGLSRQNELMATGTDG